MYKIIEKIDLNSDISSFKIHAPHIATKREPGQFVVLRINEQGERIPITIADSDNETITIIVQGIGKTTKHLNSLKTGDSILDVVGPLGKATPIEKLGTVVSIGGGVGCAEALPIAKSLKEAGNRLISISGFRTKNLVILEDEIKNISDEFYVTTDDGSYGMHGLVTDKLSEIISKGKVDMVLAIGPVPMMQAVCNLTKKHNIKTIVSLNAIMIDATGMCGVCRVRVGGKTKFTCVDGPEFDGHDVDWTLLKQRQSTYKKEEQVSLARFEETCKCGK